MINVETTLPILGSMRAAALDHRDRAEPLLLKAAEMEEALERYFLPDQEITLDEAVSACVTAATLWADVTGNRWSADRAAVAEYLTHKYQFIFGQPAELNAPAH
ncbi:hypothetical protein [Rhizobium rhizogenes]|uniref:Uncharacterized protein n=1 Tax=Rhizobium rhizogenes NBRC 13257 TaxID=1220581 RepID=A0AA87U7C7_RHIRH|nr:hypothetical protein [Rhizobium rhizogenes]NTG68241.1 hypothetical protein [Rhizobium rhizogenes]NTI69060.1 hypothetical protein [Rhizobium rhizogenes]TRB12885.1 hypothetical protein EXN67_09450 [Rhizobium rhizogenes]TRB37456.1 hypothetical protein EXN73_30930 [Rhizobium rhizogenes]TRB52242.1 hypothetical protein EXN71_31370 [Rhizobium rhizogenes]